MVIYFWSHSTFIPRSFDWHFKMSKKACFIGIFIWFQKNTLWKCYTFKILSYDTYVPHHFHSVFFWNQINIPKKHILSTQSNKAPIFSSSHIAKHFYAIKNRGYQTIQLLSPNLTHNSQYKPEISISHEFTATWDIYLVSKKHTMKVMRNICIIW